METEKKNEEDVVFKAGDQVIVKTEGKHLAKYNESPGVILEELAKPPVISPWIDNIPKIYSVLVSPKDSDQPEVVAFYTTELSLKD